MTPNASIAGAREDLNLFDDLIRAQLPLLKPVADSWQPADILPDFASPNWREEITALQTRSASLSDEALVVLVGNLVTEEALPSYQTWLHRAYPADTTGASETPWGQWARGWTAEENRHGELLNKYLYLTGRVDMRAMEITTHHLIKNGFDLKSREDRYRAIVYVCFQERATKISHANTGRLAEKCGDSNLAKICSLIAADEARHEEAYKRMFAGMLEIEPSKAVIAFSDMMRQKIAMPARLMSDGTDTDLFDNFAVVAQRSGVYTIRDYASVIAHLVEYWGIGSVARLTPEAAKAQEYVCNLSAKFLDKAPRVEEIVANIPVAPFSWIYGRSA